VSSYWAIRRSPLSLGGDSAKACRLDDGASTGSASPMIRGAPYRLSARDVAAGAAELATAFAEYPTFAVLFPNALRRPSDIAHVMRFFIHCGLLRGEVLATSGRLEAISIWYRSPEASFGLETAIRAGALRLPLRLGWRSFMRFKLLGDTKQRQRHERMPDRCHLLDIIGVGPHHAGKGFATGLLEAKLAQLDSEGQSAYLETSDPRNIGYYNRFGFAVVSSYRSQDLESFCMLRGPVIRGDNAITSRVGLSRLSDAKVGDKSTNARNPQ